MQRREFFRIIFPIAEKIYFLCDRYDHQLLELAEQSIKIKWNSECSVPKSGQKLIFTGSLHDGGIHTLTGHVSRISDNELVVNLELLLSQKIIIAEQRYLLNKYGSLEGVS